ncbi:MAG: DNA polymerase III subunit beta [Planctomycetes bacterium]|nr:DNA polymerase III subunit beta [Planctomycetota bacterium]
MIIHCQRDGLLTACQLVGAAVAARTPKTILMNIKAVAEDDKLVLVATDLEIGMRYELAGVRVEEPGEAMLPVSRLTSILRESPDSEVMIDADERRCKVSTTASEYEMPSEDPSGFPDVPVFGDSKFHELTAGVLRTMIRRTAFSAAKQDTKYAITGLLWEPEDKKVRLVGTDTRRLAVCLGNTTVPAEGDTKGQSHLIPVKAMSLLERTLTDDSELIKVCARANDVLFQTEKATICSRLLEGRYPPYRDIIPKKAAIKIPLQVNSFLSAVRQAAIMADDESKRVAFNFEPGKLTLQAQGAATGKSKVELQIDYKGAPISINFDPNFVADMLKVLDPSEAIQLDLVDSQKPALFRVGDDYLYLVMPLT